MSLLRTDDQEVLLAAVSEMMTGQVAPQVAAHDQAGECPREFFAPAFEMGLHMLEVPEEFGGAGLDFQTAAMVFEEIAKADAGYAISLMASFVAFRNVRESSSPEQVRLFADRLAPGGFAAFALSEAGAGSDIGAMTTAAVREGEDYVITGAKAWITNAAWADLFVVLAKTDPAAGSKGVSCFLVEADRPGLSVGHHEDKLGLRLSNT
ncbi:MAG: acyl-CoA dehydrogenase family protein, partial [Bifidobacteriaceae bacterium]|nr:acyl-CoA dehydrogenase family protein [Bifidobacteriaceae bacterium]